MLVKPLKKLFSIYTLESISLKRFPEIDRICRRHQVGQVVIRWVYLVDNSSHCNHFAGFILKEEIAASL
jgi:hypothetical protein